MTSFMNYALAISQCWPVFGAEVRGSAAAKQGGRRGYIKTLEKCGVVNHSFVWWLFWAARCSAVQFTSFSVFRFIHIV